MFSEEEVLEIINNKIKEDESLGEQAGGSGHLGFVHYELTDHCLTQIDDNQIKIEYHYRTIVETEFTYYPDNPPMEYPHSKIIIVDKDKKIISQEEILPDISKYSTTEDDPEWLTVQDNIMKFVENFLADIEWKYGDNRAPIKYPPDFYKLLKNELNDLDYCCRIDLDLGDDESMYFKSDDPAKLLDQIKKEFKNRFSDSE